MRAGDIVEEPFIIHRIGTPGERRVRVVELFAMVGLDNHHLQRYPHEFSAGQRQRISIARALALRPAFVVAGEAVPALDVPVQAQVVMLELKDVEIGDTTALFSNPADPYTRALLSASSFDPRAPLCPVGSAHFAAISR